MEEPIIKIRNLSKQYRLGSIGGGTLTADLQSWFARKRGKEDPNTVIGFDQKTIGKKFLALDDVNIDIYRGEAVGIIGANGAGKSTLLKILSRVTIPTEGDIWINGKISSMLEVGTGFHGELTGRENVYMNGAILGMSKQEIDEKMDDIIEFSECGKFIDTPVKRYSSGMYVRLAFAVAAHLDADILLMDEVLAVGDMKFQEKCLKKMGDSANLYDKTILYVSHNMATVRNLCTRCIVLEHGHVIFNGDTEEAINIYLNNYLVSEANVDFSDIKRTDQDMGDAVFTSFHLVNSEKNEFYLGEKMHFNMKMQGVKGIENSRVRITIYYADGSPVTSMYTDDMITIEQGEVKTFELIADISILAPGKYSMDFILEKVNDRAAATRYDCVKREVSFVVKTIEGFNHNLEWGHKSWGHVVFPNIEIK